MLVLNVSHPLADSQLLRVSARGGDHVERVVAIPVSLDPLTDFGAQTRDLADAAGLDDLAAILLRQVLEVRGVGISAGKRGQPFECRVVLQLMQLLLIQ